MIEETATLLDDLATSGNALAHSRSARALPGGLSPREAEVLRLVAEGLTNPQVAERLYLSPRTVDAHLQRIYGKLGITSRAAAVRFAVDHGLA